MPHWFHSQRPDGTWEHTRVPELETPPETPVKPPSYIVGLDLGKMADYTALSILERTGEPACPASYRARYLRRWPLKTTYPAIVQDVAMLVGRPPLGPGTDLVIDHGGVGIAVADQFRLARLAATLSLVTITGGDVVHGAMEQGVMSYSVPKRELVASVTLLLQQDRLKVAPDLPEARVLVDELGAFEVRISPSGHDSYDARSGQHDDLVLSVALAAWFGERPKREAYVY